MTVTHTPGRPIVATMLRHLVRCTRRTPATIRRTYVARSSPSLRPATATAVQPSEPPYAAAAVDEIIPHHHRAHDGHLKPLPERETTATPAFHNPSFTILPSPIPLDEPRHKDASPRPTQSELYPSTGLLDALSLISICLVKRATVPRGYEIFRRILADVAAGRCTAPDAAVWGSVIEAISSLSLHVSTPTEDTRAAEAAQSEADAWARRARELVGRWEEVNGAAAPGGSRVRAWGLKRGGEKVYQAWLRGLLR